MSSLVLSESAKPWAAAGAVTLLGAGLLATLTIVGSAQLVAVTIGVALLLLGGWISGNPRLLWVWGLGVTLPLNLSKKFGVIVNMGGGENTFRIEVSDVFVVLLAISILRDLAAPVRPDLAAVEPERRGILVPKVLWLWVAIMLLGVVSILFVPWRRIVAFEIVRMLRMALLFLVVCNELDRPRRMLHATAGLTLGLLVNAVAGILQYTRRANLGLEVLGETSERTIEVLAMTSIRGEKVWRSSGFLLHPNVFGIYLAALLPLAIAAFLVSRSRGAKVFFLGSVCLGLAALIGTQSRSGWVSFAAATALLLTLMILRPGTRRRSLRAFGVAAVALVVVLAAFRGPIMTRLFESQEIATTGREEFKSDARRMIADRPLFGHGLNSYVQTVAPYMKFRPRDYEYWLPPVHQIYYLWTAETGFVGLALHLLLWGSIVATAFANLKVDDDVLFAVDAASLAGFLAFAVDGLFSFSLRLNGALKVFWVLAGFVMAIRAWRRRRPREPGDPV